MRKFLIASMATLFAFTLGFSQKPIKTKETPKVVGWFSAGIFGCWGWNFCDGSAPWHTLQGSTIQTLYDDNTMHFKIPLSSLTEQNREFYSNAKVFVLDQDTPMAEDESRLFELSPSTTYLKGMYDLKNDGKYLEFSVKIRR